MTARARVLAGGCAVAVVLALVAGFPAPARAQAATPTFILAAQSPWIAPGGTFAMQLDAAGVPPGAHVALTVHDALQSRTAFDESVSGGSLPPTRDRQTFAFDQLPLDPGTGRRVVAYPSGALGDGGVFPVEVDLRSGDDQSLARFVTHVVVAPVGADGALAFGQPLHVAWVWPLQADPVLVAGTPPINPETFADLQPTGRLGRQAAHLALAADVPLTLAPSPETLEAWAALSARSPELQAGVEAVRAALGRDQVLAGPYVPLDLPSIERADFPGDVVTRELARGASALEAFFGTHIDPSTALPGPLDGTALTTLQRASVRQLVVDGRALTPANEKFTPAHPYKMQTVPGDDTSAVTVVATDPGLEEFLSGDQPPALRAAHLLAGLALVAGEQPSITRGVALVNPVSWDADDTFVSAVLNGLRGNPLLRATTVDDLIRAVPVATTDGEPDGTPVYRQLAPASPSDPPVRPAQYARAVRSRDAVAAVVGASDPRTERADRKLAVSLSARWANPAGRATARALLQSIDQTLHDYLAAVQVQPKSTVTITSSKAEIPISFRNTGDDPIAVHLQLESDRLLFPDGAARDLTLPPHHNTTVRVAVETRGSGTANVLMNVTTPGGLAIGGPSRIAVRSTFVSGVGVFLTVGAIVFLALWWGWDIHRRRKKRARERHPTYRLAPPPGQPA